MYNVTIDNRYDDMYYYLNPCHLTRVHIDTSAHACAWLGEGGMVRELGYENKSSKGRGLPFKLLNI